MTRKIFKKLHLWLAVPFGLIVTLICLSGAILIFEKDFGSTGPTEVASQGRSPLPLYSILRLTESSLADNNQIVGVTIYPDSEHAYKVLLAKPSSAALWVDQYSGKVAGKYDRAKIFKVARAAHRRLFGKTKKEGASGGKTGKLMIGITTLALLLIIITGLGAWWPTKGILKKKLTIAFGRGSYRFWYDFHCVGGVACSAVLLVCILTGLNWSFGWYKTAFYATFGTEIAKTSGHKKAPLANYAALQSAYSQIRSQNPDKEIRILRSEVEVAGDGYGNQQATSIYKIDPRTGAIKSVITYDDKALNNHIKGWVYTLHVGSWFGWFSKIFYLLCVLVGATLPLSGYYLWLKRLSLKKKTARS